MPGHIKLTTGQPDPDPSEYLLSSPESKRADGHKPYDPKASVWIPCPKTGGYREGLLQEGSLEDPASKCVVGVAHEKFTHKASEIGKVNPPKFEKCEDMVNLTFLNDASVFWNLKTRYQAKMIHTYSGLFVVVVNPYKRFPIYTHRVSKIYLGKRRNEVPPHLWAIAETAYRGMISNGKNQAMLITGESGAGKTENTKKVITYLAIVASSSKKSEKKVTLEDQIVATNPILESYGNAKTSRNDNSSRFGKFIRIHFNSSGKLAGCDIVSYLLEKSRITEQQEVERSYHIFYQLLVPAAENIGAGLKNLCHLSEDIYDYNYVSQGKTKVDSIDDNEEMEYTEDAFNVLGFLAQEKFDCYTLTAAVMTFGELKYSQKGRDEQAECQEVQQDGWAWKAAALCGVEPAAMIKAFCKPRIKVGTEWVTKGQNVEQATNATGGIARAIYDRLFKWLIEKCNETLIDPEMKKVNFCAVLDIAGFEIFEYNGFEQICINFVNEKLQQFFNHHMFVVEQETYIGEGIEWQMVDFGLDLQACITMFEKPMGLWAILEEESLFPKATDKSFEEKLRSSLGKLPIFLKPQSKTDKHAHFAISHYAGVVSYNVAGWLEKNKDPVNDSVVELFKSSSSCALMVRLWADHPGQPTVSREEGKKKKKGGGGKTVSSVYLQSLSDLMTTLYSCEPHFVRCIVPNTHKKPGDVEPPLIMHQLTCNGVLEGIRICMRGFPNRVPYPDFRARYWILAQAEINSSSDNKVAVYAMMDKINFSRERYRLGHSMVFFRAGAMARLEEERDAIVLALVRKLQGEIVKRFRSREYNKRRDQRELVRVCQRQLRKYLALRDWGWFIILQKTRPLVGLTNPEEELRLLEEQARLTYDVYMEKLETKKKLEEENRIMEEENKGLLQQVEKEQGNLGQYHERQAVISAEKSELEKELLEKQQRLASLEAKRMKATASKKSVEQDNASVKKEIVDLEFVVTKLEQEKSNKDHTINSLNAEIENKDVIINKLNKEKKRITENNSKASEDLQNQEEKYDHLLKVKSKLEQTVDEIETAYEAEKRQKMELDKQRRKMEGDLKICQQTLAELERKKKDIESSINRKETDRGEMMQRLEAQQVSVSKIQKQIKEQQARVEELEEELQAERGGRAKAERQRGELSREMEEVGERLLEAGGATQAQIELNKKREIELARMRKDMEECLIQNEANMASLKKKQQDATAEMSDQIEQLSQLKSKIDRDKSMILSEISDIRAATEEVNRSRAAAEKQSKTLAASLTELNKKIEAASLTLADIENYKRKMEAENGDLLLQLQDLEISANLLSTNNKSLGSALEEQKQVCDDEAKERSGLLSKYRNLELEQAGLQEQLSEETISREDVVRQAAAAGEQILDCRRKYEESQARAEEMEMAKLKLQARLSEAEATMENLHNKLYQLEKKKTKTQTELDEVTTRLDKAAALNSALEKKAKQFDRIVAEWKHRVESLSLELDTSQNETRNVSSELFRMKNAYDEAVLMLDDVRKENKNLSAEIKDLMDQITEGGRTIHEIDKIRQRLQTEKLELESALSEAEGALEQEENKVVRLQLELGQVKEEIERKMAEKDEEFQCSKKQMTKALEGLQMSLEAECKAKAEALRIKRKLEADVSELEAGVEAATAANVETQRTVRRLVENLREAGARLDREAEARTEAQERLLAGDRRAAAARNGLEEARAMLDQSDRARRELEQELGDSNETLGEQTCQNQALVAAIRRSDQEITTLNNDLDEMSAEQRMSEEKAQRAMLDAARLAEELRSEQDLAGEMERNCKLLELQVKEAANKLDEIEQNALRGGRKAVAKMELRIKELSSEQDAESRRHTEAQKNLRKSERRVVELSGQQEEDRKNRERMQGLVDGLQNKVKTYKKQIEEAEEIAALNLAKFRQVSVSLAEVAGRAELSEQAVARLRTSGRDSSQPRHF